MSKYLQRMDPMSRLITEAYGGRVITFHSGLAKALDSNNAALFLQQCLYWSRITDDQDGWFWKTIAEFQDEINMSKYEQGTAIKILMKYGLIEKKRSGSGAKRYFRVDIDALSLFLEDPNKAKMQVEAKTEVKKPEVKKPAFRSQVDTPFFRS